MNIKKYIIKITYLIIFLFFVGCTNVWNQTTPFSFLPIDQFLFLKKQQILKLCSDQACSQQSIKFSASAFIVGKTINGSLAITASHVCENKNLVHFTKNKDIKASIKYEIISLKGKKYKAKPLTYNSNIDICMLFVEKLINIEPVELARRAPTIGDKVYNIAAPVGYFTPNMVPIFEGRYSGNYHNAPWAIYTLPVIGGSSGSMILNHKGRLIGIIHSVHRHFHHIAVGTTYEDTRKFIENKLEYYRIYVKDMKTLDLPDIFKVN